MNITYQDIPRPYGITRHFYRGPVLIACQVGEKLVVSPIRQVDVSTSGGELLPVDTICQKLEYSCR